MIFLIDELVSKYEVRRYKCIIDLTSRIEWQDIFEGNSIIIDINGLEYEWDINKKDEIGSTYHYTMRKTNRKSSLILKCLNILNTHKDLTEFIILKGT